MINLRKYFNDGPRVRHFNGMFCVGADIGLHGSMEVN
jgi:hypothetical protein